jgi:single stranded DNA-binding protein
MNLNHFMISGNLTRDPEMRTVGADRAVTAFTIAHNTRFKTTDGEQREEVSFIDCEAWGRQGEIAAQYLTKGSAIIVEGRLKQDNWTDKEGQKRSKLKLAVDRVHLLPRLVRDDHAGSDHGETHDTVGEPLATTHSTMSRTENQSGPRSGVRSEQGAGYPPPTRVGAVRTAPANSRELDQPPF